MRAGGAVTDKEIRMLTRCIGLGDALRNAFDDMIAEAEAELVEHEEHVADAKRRLANIQTLRAAMGRPAAAEACQ